MQATHESVVEYSVSDGIATITMNRPEYHNAQNSKMTYALDAAFKRASNDDAVKVIVLAGAGKHFSAGHDIGTPGRDIDQSFERTLTVVGPCRQAERREFSTPASRRLSRHVPPLARSPQTDHRHGARRVRRRRPDAGLDLRPDRRLRTTRSFRTRWSHMGIPGVEYFGAWL